MPLPPAMSKGHAWRRRRDIISHRSLPFVIRRPLFVVLRRQVRRIQREGKAVPGAENAVTAG